MRRQVCKRIGRRMQGLGLAGPDAYRRYLENHPDEWQTLESFCRISISRFGRDWFVFEALRADVLPTLAEAARTNGGDRIRCWSAGCASGEEPYGLCMLWNLEFATRFRAVSLDIIATEADEALLRRAEDAVFRKSSLKELSPSWIAAAFEETSEGYALRPEFRAGIAFRRQDLRTEGPGGPFDLVLCRNLAFTYFDESHQRTALRRIASVLRTGGALVIGRREALPGDCGFEAWVEHAAIFRRTVLPVPEPTRS